jgi:hypothetical protein
MRGILLSAISDQQSANSFYPVDEVVDVPVGAGRCACPGWSPNAIFAVDRRADTEVRPYKFPCQFDPKTLIADC